jgi:uncharacterized OsmC-like protein
MIEFLEDASRNVIGRKAVTGQRSGPCPHQLVVASLRGFRAPKLGEKYEKKFEP